VKFMKAAVSVAFFLISGLHASDLLLTNGHIYTGNVKEPWAEAIAITGTRIDAAGSNQDVAKNRSSRTKVIDLRGRTVIPGIIDSHTHLWMGALAIHGFNLATPDVYIEPKDEAQLAAKIKEYAAAHPKDKVLFGRVQFPNTVTHELLDRAVPDRPVVIHAPTEHTYWVNAKALALAGITEKPLADPELDKFVVRDKQGRPTGVLREGTMRIMDRALPAQPLTERMAWMSEALKYMARFGITSVTNATGDLNELEVYGALRDKHQLPVRVRMAFANVASKHLLTPQFLADLEKARAKYNDEWVSANLVKFFADGAGTAALYEPEEFTKLVVELDKRGYQIMTHALGAAPAHMVLDAYEQIEKTNGSRDRRLRIEHAMRIPLADVSRAARMGVTASMQSDFCCFNDPPDAPSNIWQTLEKNGVNLAFGSDFPCTFPPNPFGGMQQAVLRELRTLFTAPVVKPPQYASSTGERLTIQQAVDAYTKGSAYARFSDNKLGTLEAGKEADLAVLSQDIFGIRPEEIGKTTALMTMTGGKIVYEDPHWR
jgi:predicted amidohydrolase YtcJ